jgi:carbon-monoxide dehydrogenase medium subunit
MLESSALLREKIPVLPVAAAQIGDVQVRNRGTIGGSLAHGDPAADLPAAVLALNARMKVVGSTRAEEIQANRFFVDMLQTAVQAGEILTEVRIKKSESGNGSAYLKVAQPASGFAIVGVAATLTVERGKCVGIRIGITGVGTKPYRASEVEARLLGTTLDAESLRAACARAADGIEALSDIHASAEYRKDLAAIYTRRCVEAAAARARLENDK